MVTWCFAVQSVPLSTCVVWCVGDIRLPGWRWSPMFRKLSSCEHRRSVMSEGQNGKTFQKDLLGERPGETINKKQGWKDCGSPHGLFENRSEVIEKMWSITKWCLKDHLWVARAYQEFLWPPWPSTATLKPRIKKARSGRNHPCFKQMGGSKQNDHLYIDIWKQSIDLSNQFDDKPFEKEPTSSKVQYHPNFTHHCVDPTVTVDTALLAALARTSRRCASNLHKKRHGWDFDVTSW